MSIYERREAFPLFDPLSSAKRFSVQYLERGRVGWDIPHSTAVANYAIQIARGEGLDELVLGTAAWLHDIGYYQLFNPNHSPHYSSSTIEDRKQLHMQKGAQLTKEYLETVRDRSWYTTDQEREIIELVGIHDSHHLYSKPHHFAFGEADTLGTIGIMPTFESVDAAQHFSRKLISERVYRFQTQTGIDIFNRTLPEYFRNLERLGLLESQRRKKQLFHF